MSQRQMTKGSWFGHVCRRLIHLSMVCIPLIYYPYKAEISAFFHLPTMSLLLILLGLILIFEVLRIKFNIVFFGQRVYEASQISAMAWGGCGVILVLLVSPGIQFSVPIIWSLALIDPLLGELRHFAFNSWVIMSCGLVGTLAIWWGSAFWFGMSLWWGILIAPLTIAAEQLKLKWVDDNALMLLAPLVVVLLGGMF